MIGGCNADPFGIGDMLWYMADVMSGEPRLFSAFSVPFSGYPLPSWYIALRLSSPHGLLTESQSFFLTIVRHRAGRGDAG